jgi:Mn2+/Fe2+ NRAMP family transporter
LLDGENGLYRTPFSEGQRLGISVQVCKTFLGVPKPLLLPLLIHCRNRNVMGALANHRRTTVIATVDVTLFVSLNVFLLYQTFFS